MKPKETAMISEVGAVERWSPVVGYEGLYEVSGMGRIRGLPRRSKGRRSVSVKGRILLPRFNKQGYVTVVLRNDRGPKNYYVHRLVCAAFLGPPPIDRTDVNHKNGVTHDNRLTNLEWSNDKLNVAHAFRVLERKSKIGDLRPWLGKSGESNPHSKPVIQISANGVERRFPGISEAGRITGLCFKRISACCRGKRSRHGGFKWRFEDPHMNDHYRQGDVALISIPALPDDAVALPDSERVVLKEGEATNHFHAFYNQSVRVFVTPAKARYLHVVETSYLKHEEHSTVEVPPGIYKLPTQVEWSDSDEPIAVAD